MYPYHTIDCMTIKLHHALLGFLVFALATSLIRNGTNTFHNMPFYDRLKADYEAEQARNEKLKLDAARAKDPFEAEKLLRDQLGLIKENERVIVLPDSPEPTPTPTPTN